MNRTERAALVEALPALPAQQWDRPSLCAGWTVRDVDAPRIATACRQPPCHRWDGVQSSWRTPLKYCAQATRMARFTEAKYSAILPTSVCSNDAHWRSVASAVR